MPRAAFKMDTSPDLGGFEVGGDVGGTDDQGHRHKNEPDDEHDREDQLPVRWEVSPGRRPATSLTHFSAARKRRPADWAYERCGRRTGPASVLPDEGRRRVTFTIATGMPTDPSAVLGSRIAAA